MTPPATGIGPQFPQPDPRGILTFKWLPADLQHAEDTTYAHDSGLLQRYYDPTGYGWTHRTMWFRDATAAERTLLEHLGYTVPETLWTRVEYKTASVRHRSWPALEENP